MFPRVTHPSAADVSRRPLDLHVLSLPPAFVLSQDQTLRLNRDLSRPVTQILVRPSQEQTRSDEFQTHPLKAAIRPNRLPTLKTRLAPSDDESRNVTVAISSDPDQTQPSRPRSRKKPPKPKPSQGPARTPPPTSPFLPMQLSNSNPRASAPAT